MPGIYPALFSGSGGISSAAVPDPYVPVDGTMNVTGAVTASGAVAAGSLSSTTTGTALAASGSSSSIAFNNTSAASIGQIKGYAVDGATTVALRLAAQSDLTTAGAKILSIGDNAGTSYAEKAYVDKDGLGSFAGGLGTAAGTPASASTVRGRLQADTWIDNSNSVTVASWSSPDFSFGNAAGASGSLGGLRAGGITAEKTTDYVATKADFLIPVNVNTTGDVAITLPAASAAKGQILNIKATATHATRDININRAGADTITTYAAAGATTVQLSPTATLSQATLVSDGTSIWYVVSLDP